jgi:hypothetical protein
MSFWTHREFVADYVRQPDRLLDLKSAEERPKNLAVLAEVHNRILKKLGVSAVSRRQTNGTGPEGNYFSMIRIIDPSEIPLPADQTKLSDSQPDGSGEMESDNQSNIVLLSPGQ